MDMLKQIIESLVNNNLETVELVTLILCSTFIVSLWIILQIVKSLGCRKL